MGKDFTSCRGDDNVYTPYSMTEQLLEHEKFDYNKKIWECACGENAIYDVLLKHFSVYKICNTDIKKGYDFLIDENKQFRSTFDYIITNPPYSKLDKFIVKAKEIATEKFAFLCKLTHLGGIDRLLFNVYKDQDFPLTKIYLFVRQANLRFTTPEQEAKGYIPYREIRIDGKYPAGMYYYCWLIWENYTLGRFNKNAFPTFHWINNNEDILRS